MIHSRLGAKNGLEPRQIVAEIPFRLFKEQEEAIIHLARRLCSRLAETHHGTIAAKDVLLADIRIRCIKTTAFIFCKEVRAKQNAHSIHKAALFHHETCDRTRLRVAFKAFEQVFCPRGVKFQVHVAKHLNLGIHLFQETVTGARISQILGALRNLAIQPLFFQEFNGIIRRSVIKNKNPNRARLRL